MTTFNIDLARTVAVTNTDIGKVARHLEKACDEIERLRLELVKAANYAESSAHIARRALEGDTPR